MSDPKNSTSRDGVKTGTGFALSEQSGSVPTPITESSQKPLRGAGGGGDGAAAPTVAVVLAPDPQNRVEIKPGRLVALEREQFARLEECGSVRAASQRDRAVALNRVSTPKEMKS